MDQPTINEPGDGNHTPRRTVGDVHVAIHPEVDEHEWASAFGNITGELRSIRTWPHTLPTWITAIATTACAILLATR